ncbi:sulfatase-like hydrolase/transferase [Holdemania massiliensis]|uniref:sulfatase-like hydrolase/transferase n=1 Tax=Holdemania massiliensis TaxID=1468449 RepID=UPI003521ADC9
MKNIVLVVVDGLTYHITQSHPHHQSPMKFVNSIKEQSIWCEKAFSHGPYTEAGIKSVLHGKFPLENGGYYTEHLAWDDSMMKICKDYGYDLFTTYFASFIPPECLHYGGFSYNVKKGNPMFSRYLSSKLDYYYPIWRSGKFTQTDYDTITWMLQRFFKSAEMLYSPVSRDNDYTGDLTPYDCEDTGFLQRERKGLEKLKVESIKFDEDYKTYIDDVFSNYSTHPLVHSFDWKASNYTESISKQKDWLSTEYSSLFKRIKKTNKHYYLKNNLPTMENSINHFKKCCHRSTAKEGIEYFLRLYKSIFNFNYSKMLDKNLQQICTSAGSFVEQFCDWHSERKKQSPYFAYFHFDEFHRPLSFITHESTDYEHLRVELRNAEDYINHLPKDYKGDIGFDLAAGYIDGCIEKLFTYLKDVGELENTVFVITADHGSSNCGETARYTFTNHFFKEQYHIPVMIYGYGKKEIKSYVWGVDVPFTLLELCGIKQPDDWSGSSFIDNDREYTFVEYTGGGVSDILRRPVMYGYRDDNKSFVVKAVASENLTINDFELREYYDLINDPNEIRNLCSVISNEEALTCKSFFINRLRYLYDENKIYLNTLNCRINKSK